MSELMPQLFKLGFFWLAIALLVTVTLGVAYLTIVEMKDRKDRDQVNKDALLNRSGSQPNSASNSTAQNQTKNQVKNQAKSSTKNLAKAQPDQKQNIKKGSS